MEATKNICCAKNEVEKIICSVDFIYTELLTGIT